MYSYMEPYHSFEESEIELEHFIEEVSPEMYEVTTQAYHIRQVVRDNPAHLKPFHQPISKKEKKYGQEMITIVSFTPHPDFTFMSDCCRLDMKSYVEDESILEGVAINGVFFNYKSI